MEIIKRKHGAIRYREMIRINGKALQGPVFKRKTDAKNWKNRKLNEKSTYQATGRELKVQESISFETFATNWLEGIVKNELAPRTYDNYKSVITFHLIPFFDKRTVQNIRIEDARKLILLLRSKGHNGKGINIIIGVLKSVFNYAKGTGHLIQTPMEGLGKQKEDLRCDSYWTKAELGQFLLAVREKELFPLYFTALHTGLRLGELCALKWDRVDFGLGQITVSRIRDKQGLRETTKTKLKRIVPIVPELKGLFVGLYRRRAEHGYVFCQHDSSPIDYGHIYRRFQADQKRTGMLSKLRFHDLRHTFASMFMMNGGNIFELQKILGHSAIEMTMRYAHFTEGHLQQAALYMDMGLKIIENAPDSHHGQEKKGKSLMIVNS